MSHKATNWAVTQRGLKPTSKILLWHLADCHNSHSGRCDPSQIRLAYDCEISPATLNRHLGYLEERGLIARQKRFDSTTKQQQTTFYILGFDIADTHNDVEADSQNDTRKADSQKQANPTLKNDESRLSERESNLVREPVIEPCAETRKQVGFKDFWKKYPRLRNELKSSQLFKEAVESGVSPAWIVSSARAYAIEQNGNDTKYVAYSDNWLADGRWQDFREVTNQTETTDVAEFWAASIKEGRYISPMSMTAGLIDEMLHRKLVTEQDLHARGIRY